MDSQKATTFKNDTVSFKSKDDVLTYLIHLGYLAFISPIRRPLFPMRKSGRR